MNYVIVLYDEPELPFIDVPSLHGTPSTLDFRTWAANGWDIHWNYRGLVGVLPNNVIVNTLAEYDAHQSKRHRREAVPKGVGKFTWSQTISLEEAEKLRKSNASPETASGSEAGD